MSLLILIGFPFAALIACIASTIHASKYDKELLNAMFSLRLHNAGPDASASNTDFTLVNAFTELDLADTSVWMQTKL